MSDPSERNAVDNLDDLGRQAAADGGGVLDEVAGSSSPSSSEFELFIDDDDAVSVGFAFLRNEGAAAVHGFKLLEIAHSVVGGDADTVELSEAERALLERMLGASFLGRALTAYTDCKDRTQNLEEMHDLDELARWRLIEFIQLYEKVMYYGMHTKRLARAQASRVLQILVHDYGEYFGLLVDDSSAESQEEAVARVASYLSQFRRSSLYTEVPREHRTRFSRDDPRAVQLLDFEIARGIAPHALAVKEAIIHAAAGGGLNEKHPVDVIRHALRVHYAFGRKTTAIPIINAILPVFVGTLFDGFDSIPEVERHIEARQAAIRLDEQRCFAILRCLKHYQGSVPRNMREFEADAVQAAVDAQSGDDAEPAPLTVEPVARMSGMFQPVSFAGGSRRPLQIEGHPVTVKFFGQPVAIGIGDQVENSIFFTHVHTDRDPEGKRPLMYEYQVVLDEGVPFDAHAAARDLFKHAPQTFRQTLAAGQIVLFAREVVGADQRANAELDPEETNLLANYIALQGGMQSRLGQHYVLSHEGSTIFSRYPDVRDYLTSMVSSA